MKRYLLQLTALSLLALATGCQKEQGEINNPQNSQSAAVNISIDGLSIDATASRAVIVDMPDFSKNGFKIAGYYTVGIQPVPPDVPGTSGRFDDNIATAYPNVFDYKGIIGESVIVPKLKDGKYHVTLSQWGLLENSYLSYFAWASNVEAGVAEGAATNPIVSSTKHGDKGAPFIKVTSGSTSASLNVDVVAAKSADNSNDVVRSAIDLDFKHVMTKLKFSVKNSSPVDMTLTGAKILFAAGKVSRGAKYSFDGSNAHVGTWGTPTDTEAATYTVALTPTNVASNGTAVALDELLIIPQALAAGAISVELTYTIPNGTGTSTYTRTAPLKARTVEQNTSYTYEIALNETTISINEGRIGAWIDTSTGDLPYVAGARDANVQLLLDAYDAPYTHTDGTQYWLDRSGWNRHCKLVGGVTYDVAGKFYKFSDIPSRGTYMEVPPTFTATTDATIETITRSTRSLNEGGSQLLFEFTNAASSRVMSCQLSYGGSEEYYFDTGGNNRVSSKIPMSIYREFAMYSFSKSMSGQYMRRNLSYYDNVIKSGGNASVDLSTVVDAKIGNVFKGEIKYFKITSTAKTTIDATEYASLSKRHKIKNTDYVEDGLLFDLRGTDPPVNNSWVDRVKGYKSLTSGGRNATQLYVADKKEYDVEKGMDIRFEFPDEVAKADIKNMTFEFVAYRPYKYDDWGDLGTHNGVGTGEQTSHGVYVRLYNVGEPHLFICVPMNAPYNQYSLVYQYPGGVHGWQTMRRHYCITRETLTERMSILYGNNVQLATRTDALSVSLPETRVFRADGIVKISAVRMYNRKLTDTERNYNHISDKTVYNIP